MAILTLSQALDRAQAGEPIAPTVPKHQAHLRALATNVLARQAALKEAKRQLQAQGFRPSHFSHRDLVIRAEQYLAAHREELIAEAKVVVERWRLEGFFGKRAKLLSDAQGAKV
jgi:hypothetical protein